MKSQLFTKRSILYILINNNNFDFNNYSNENNNINNFYEDYKTDSTISDKSIEEDLYLSINSNDNDTDNETDEDYKTDLITFDKSIDKNQNQNQNKNKDKNKSRNKNINDYAILNNKNDHGRKWNYLTLSDLYIWLEIIIYSEIFKTSSFQDYWNTSLQFLKHSFTLYMSQIRFE